MRLEWTEPALADLEHIRHHISKDSAIRANRFVARLFQAAERLEDFPRVGREVPEARDTPEEIREVIYRAYRIIYWLETDNHAHVLTVIRGNQDLAGTEPKPWASISTNA